MARMRAKHFAEVCAENIVEQAAADYLRENEYTYSDFAAVLYNEGKVVSIETIPCNINRVRNDIASAVNPKLADSGTISDRIPVGSLTGSYLLAGKGPKLKVKICPEGRAETEIRSEMESAGINQTRHRISAVITVKLTSSLPLYSFDSEVKYEFLLAETVIIGDVPDFVPYTWKQK
ncbi:MAG: sporulation protein YunB [Ruminococcus sp.]|nr:sporulation protein YunB [Ruminococcus sp.]